MTKHEIKLKGTIQISQYNQNIPYTYFIRDTIFLDDKYDIPLQLNWK